jgi:hypothetical protein
MNIIHFVYTVFLFVVLTPAILVRLPPKGNKWLVAFVHGLLFAVILFLTNTLVSSLNKSTQGLSDMSGNEGFTDLNDMSGNNVDVSMNPVM